MPGRQSARCRRAKGQHRRVPPRVMHRLMQPPCRAARKRSRKALRAHLSPHRRLHPHVRARPLALRRRQLPQSPLTVRSPHLPCVPTPAMPASTCALSPELAPPAAFCARTSMPISRPVRVDQNRRAGSLAILPSRRSRSSACVAALPNACRIRCVASRTSLMSRRWTLLTSRPCAPTSTRLVRAAGRA